jgi:hypothetical protein
MLEVTRAEQERFLNIISNLDDWLAETRLPDWQVRDVVAHMIDETERYLDRWKMARGGELPESMGLSDCDRDAKLDERAAGILVTQYIFNLWEYMFDSAEFLFPDRGRGNQRRAGRHPHRARPVLPSGVTGRRNMRSGGS